MWEKYDSPMVLLLLHLKEGEMHCEKSFAEASLQNK